MNVNKLLEEIENLEVTIKKQFPKQKGRVLIANAKSNVDYELGKDANIMQWNLYYRDALRKYL